MTQPAAMALQAPGAARPSARVGVIGGGQLARMLHEAALPLGVEVRVLTDALDAPAVRAGAGAVVGSAGDLDDLLALADGCDVVTLDHELVDPAVLEALEQSVPVHPSSRAIRMAQDKLYARVRLVEAGCPVPAFVSVTGPRAIEVFAGIHGWPVVVKARSGGYDGRGVWIARDADEARTIWTDAKAANVELLVEAHVAIDQELAVLVARSPSGETVDYPLLATLQVDAICREVSAPADVPEAVAEEARRLALALAKEIGATGIMAVEMFLSGDQLLVNELALRPHNSGHLTIEGCPASQFEQHLRAILDWPLGSARLLAPAAAMVNLLGPADGSDPAELLPAALGVSGARIHLYGKASRPGRKIGHVTALGKSVDEALATARAATERLSG